MSSGGDGERRSLNVGLTARERGLTGRISELLTIADVMALLMVIATAFAGYATWRTSKIAQAIFLASERPYLGVQSVALDRTRPNDPRVVVHFDDFASIPAEDANLTERLLLDGKPIERATLTLAAGILSPHVAHQMQAHVPPGALEQVSSGHTRLVVEVRASYHGNDTRRFCYRERFIYLPESDTFEVFGGTPRCDDEK